MALTDKQEQDALKALEQIARLIHTYYLALIASGFTPEQALVLACSYQESATTPPDTRPLFGVN